MPITVTNKETQMTEGHLAFLLVLVFWGILLRVLQPEYKKESWFAWFYCIGMLLIIPIIVFYLVGGDKCEHY